MMPVIRISEALHNRLAKHAQGFDSPARVIERLLDQVEGIEAPSKDATAADSERGRVKTGAMGRLFNNQYIQRRIIQAARDVSDDELADLCDKGTSKDLFNINFPLFIRVPTNSTPKVKRDAVKDHNDMNRWTWKHSFERDGYEYAICTQWFEWNDQHVKAWLDKREAKQ